MKLAVVVAASGELVMNETGERDGTMRSLGKTRKASYNLIAHPVFNTRHEKHSEKSAFRF